jgi:hypothetical protein
VKQSLQGPKQARQEIRRNFLSNGVVEDWNKVPTEVKNAGLVEST